MNEFVIHSENSLQFMATSGWDFSRKWHGSVDVSVWLRAAIDPGSRIYLNLDVRDKNGRRRVIIDRCLATHSRSILLNGRIALSGMGLVSALNLVVNIEGEMTPPLVLEEVSLRPHRVAAAPALARAS